MPAGIVGSHPAAFTVYFLLGHRSLIVRLLVPGPCARLCCPSLPTHLLSPPVIYLVLLAIFIEVQDL